MIRLLCLYKYAEMTLKHLRFDTVISTNYAHLVETDPPSAYIMRSLCVCVCVCVCVSARMHACMCLCVCGPGARKTLHDAQVSSAESVPYLSPRPICSIHTQWRQVTATARHYKSTDDHQVLRPYAGKNSVNTEYYSWWCLQEVNASKNK